MNQTLLKLIGRPLRAGVRWYLSKPRSYAYRGISINVPTGVFHPGFFFSTKFILEFLEHKDIAEKKFLELGSGSGLVAVFAAKKGARVIASDINTKAVSATHENAKSNEVMVEAIYSDLFEEIPLMPFDWIIVNPPYYPSNPKTEEEHAWYCGAGHEYFKKLFSSLQHYTHSESNVLIILSDVCDIPKIVSIASDNNFFLEEIAQRSVWADGKNYLCWIKAKQ
jgi:release factor glutamine methyltransferase